MTEGNKRYLGDVVINEENYKRQREFFNDIIENWQGSRGGSFDAYGLWDRISGTVKLAEDFATAEEGALARNALQSDSVIIGANKRKKLINSVDPQNIYTDGVLLDDSNTELMSIDWLGNLSPNTLSDVLIAIDNKVIEIKNMFSDKLDVSVYDDFISNRFNPLQESLDDVFEEFVDQDGDIVTKLNANLINGIRFCLITQEKYDALPETTKKYWRNFFIIKDPADIPPEYVDPMTWELTDGYKFEVRDGYLCLNNGLSLEWKRICSLEDLVSGSDINNIIYNFITNPDNDFVIPAHNTRQSISLISPNDIDSQWRDYPFLSSNLHNDFIKTLTLNNSSNDISSTVDADGFKKVNIDINKIISDNVSSKFTELQYAIEDLDDRVKALESYKDNVEARLSEEERISAKHTREIGNVGSKSIGEQLYDLDGGVTALNIGLSDLSDSVDGTKWIKYTVPDLKRTTSKGEEILTTNWYNPKTKLAYVYFSFHHYHKQDDAGKWVNPRKTKTKFYNSKGCCVKAVPVYATACVAYTRPNHCKLAIIPVEEDGKYSDGQIFVNVDYTADTDFDVHGHVVYKFNRLNP